MTEADQKLKVLIVRLGAMGDVIHALPAVALLRAALGDSATIDWLIEPRWAELLASGGEEKIVEQNNSGRGLQKPLVDHILFADTKRWRKSLFSLETCREIFAQAKLLREEHYDIIVDLQGSMKSAYLASRSGSFVYGPDPAREMFASLCYHCKVDVTDTHVIDQGTEIAGIAASDLLVKTGRIEEGDDLDVKTDWDPHPENLPRDPAAEQWCDQQLMRFGITKEKKFAILTPGAGWPAKQWPVQKFGELAFALAKEGVLCLVNAAPNEVELAEEVVIASQDRARGVSCSIGQLIALCRRAAVFVGGDTGPMHLANALGAPTVALFGPTDPSRNGPYFQPYEVLRSPLSRNVSSHKNQHDEGLDSITVDEVMVAVRKLLA